MKQRTLLTLSLFLIAILGLQSCERLKKKMETRERRLEYFQNTIDSARKEQDKKQDSIRKQLKQ